MSNDTDSNLTPQVGAVETLNSTPLNPAAALREQALLRLRNGLRPGQQSMADWQGGSLAVSAVPGAGKSTGMAIAAAIAIARFQLHARRYLVVVTFTRSAAANIKAKIRKCLRELSLPQTGFVVYTLHGLALNIATRHSELSGLNLETATLVTPNQSNRLIRDCVERWIANNPRRYSVLLEGREFDGEETERLRRQSVLRTEVLPSLATTAVREAKSSGLLPHDLWRLAEETPDDYDILAIAAGLYEQYQALLRSRDLIDYDEMILAALRVLKNDSARQMWQNQVFAVFEDEAQDSTPLQNKLLEILATDPKAPTPLETSHATSLHLVRVGDPNQAINSTFTPADPIYFRRFCKDCYDQGRLATMDRAGRSTPIIIESANFVLDWVNRTYGGNREQGTGNRLSSPRSTAQSPLPFRPQKIRTVDADDPQADANPTQTGRGLEIYTPSDIHQTVDLIGERVIELLTENKEGKAAVLVRENRQARFVAEKLQFLRRQHGIEVYEVGESDRHSHVPAEILRLLQFLDRPHSPDYLKAALEVLVKRHLIATQDLNALSTFPEQFLYPGPLEPPQSESVLEARRYCCELLKARLELPHYQLIPFLALTLNYDQSELATAEKLAERVAQQTSGNTSMSATLEVLSEIVSSERFEAVETDDSEERYTRSGQLTIITMHKAKGLDWDYVFMPFLHEDTIPGSPWVPTAAQFLGDFTLAEVARAQIRAGLHGQSPLPQSADAWEQAGQLKTAEEFRLLYVAMTRAKRLLWMAAAQRGPFRWNTFNGTTAENLQEKKPCPVLPALKSQFPKSVVSLSKTPK
ncbi:ATP-dependent helicase [Microcoleus sp. FACHB-831]|uniref:ATP-dependent helicase n=1 Tax=Microcoleus sp. FACHB-831 TaxID=2692827 RepID=UPI0016886E20|nr:ATP-dependent helicase [Microcoleus sp. FACHB-831]MBD1920262.1 ATP-dependent helicase [Microcoleus sp. FACHB-831]